MTKLIPSRGELARQQTGAMVAPVQGAMVAPVQGAMTALGEGDDLLTIAQYQCETKMVYSVSRAPNYDGSSRTSLVLKVTVKLRGADGHEIDWAQGEHSVGCYGDISRIVEAVSCARASALRSLKRKLTALAARASAFAPNAAEELSNVMQRWANYLEVEIDS